MMHKYCFGDKSEVVNHSTIKCIDTTKGSNKNCFYGINSQKRSVVKVGPDMPFEENQKRCDYLLITETNNAYFIELKGKNDAIEQLKNSIQHISNTNNKYISENFNKIYAFAIMSRYPKSYTKTQILKDSFKKHLHTKLEIKTKQHSEELI